MGTRHLQVVIDESGETKISQYGQWDGYPAGQGLQILDYLKSGDLDKYQENLSKINQITPEQEKIINETKNCGSKIHRMIERGKVPYVLHCSKQEANKWCEGFYTIDFKKRVFIAEYHSKEKTYSFDNLPSAEKFLKDFKGSEY
jgi:hypothetical protein